MFIHFTALCFLGLGQMHLPPPSYHHQILLVLVEHRASRTPGIAVSSYPLDLVP